MDIIKDMRNKGIFIGEMRGEEAKKVILAGKEDTRKRSIYASISRGMSFSQQMKILERYLE